MYTCVFQVQGPGGQVYPRRLAPYPSPAMHMSQKRQQQVSAYPSPGPNPSMQPGFPPSGPQVRASDHFIGCRFFSFSKISTKTLLSIGNTFSIYLS